MATPPTGGALKAWAFCVGEICADGGVLWRQRLAGGRDGDSCRLAIGRRGIAAAGSSGDQGLQARLREVVSRA